jgi:hypothetical protein
MISATRSPCRRRSRGAEMPRWAPLALAAALWPGAASAQQAKEPEPPPPPPQYQVDFRADRVDIEPDSSELQLSGNVVVTVARYRIVSDKLSLSRGPRGLEVEGEGEIALCPCEDAPLTLGFQAVTVAPPTDVLLAQPTVRVGGVPLLWLPYLWLRARHLLGFIPPWLEWRGEDGLLIGAGVHLPTGGRSYRGRAAAFDLRAAGYVQGGARVDALLDTSAQRTRVVWDHLEKSALRVESLGAAIGEEASAAWVADLSRGPRGQRYPSSLDQAARRYDRVALSVGQAGDVIGGVGLRAIDRRAGDLDSLGSVGPHLHLGAGTELGSGAALDAALDVGSLRSTTQSRSDATLAVDLELQAPTGALALGGALRQRLRAGARGNDSRAALEQGWFPHASLPLQRDYGGVRHLLEPIVNGAHVLSLGSERLPGFEDAWPGEEPRAAERGQEVWALGAGLKNGLGSSRRAVTLLAMAGLVGADELAPGVAAELASDLGYLGASLQASARDEQASGLGRLRFGALDGLRVVARGEASTEGGGGAAQWLLPDNWDSPAPVLGERGVSLGGELAIPWTSWLTSEFSGDYDPEAERLLAVSSSLGYRHTCGCVSATAWAGHRVGREGFDAWLGIDLLP